MSFALEFRKKHLIEARRPGPPVSRRGMRRGPAKPREEKGARVPASLSARGVAITLLIAGLILGLFNSSALVRYARGHPDNALGPKIIVVSESWHGMMEVGRLTELSARIRAMAATARQSSWGDIAGRFGMGPQRAIRDANGTTNPEGGIITSIPGSYGDQPAKPMARTGADQSG